MPLPKVVTGARHKPFWLLVGNGVGQAVAAVAAAKLVHVGFDRLIAPGLEIRPATLALFAGGLVATTALSAWLRWRSTVDAERLGQDYVHEVRVLLFRHLARVGADGARGMSKGALVLRFVGDLTALRNWISLGLARLVVSGCAVLLALVALLFVEPVIAMAVAVAVAVSGLVALTIGPRLRHATVDARQRRGRLAATLNDRIAHLGVVEVFGQEQRERRRFSRLSQRLSGALIARARVTGLLRALSEASATVASACALIVGAIEVTSGAATQGAVVAAMVVAGLLAPRLQDLGRVYEYWNAAVVARRKQEQVLALSPVGRSARRQRRSRLRPGPGRIELQTVSFGDVLRGLSADIAAGERVAIVGRNGTGKSTLLRLIGGVLEAEDGTVLLDGQDIARCRWRDVRRAFAMVSPDLPLLRGSLRLNLCYGAKLADDSEIEAALAACRLQPLMARLPDGLATRIAEHGEGLSAGERARIALARAILVKPRVLLLDEAETYLDAESTGALDDVMARFPGTIVYVTHNAARARRADRVLELRDGQLHPEPHGAAPAVDAAGDARRVA